MTIGGLLFRGRARKKVHQQAAEALAELQKSLEANVQTFARGSTGEAMERELTGGSPATEEKGPAIGERRGKGR